MRSSVVARLERSSHGRRHALWTLFLLVGLAALITYAALPVDGQRAAYPLFGLGAGLTGVLATRLYHPPRSLPWLLLAAGVMLAGLGDLVTSMLSAAGAAQPWFLSIADLASLGGLAVFTVGLALFAGWRHGGFGFGAMIDALIVASAIGLLAWVAGLHRLIEVSGSWLAAAVALTYPFVDLVLLSLALCLLLVGGRPSGSHLLLVGGVTAWLLGDAILTLRAVAHTFEPEGLTDIARATGYLLVGAAALHPAMGDRSRHQVARFEGLPSTARVGAFIAPAFLPTLLLWVPSVTDDRVTLLGMQVGGLGLTALVELRVALMVIHAKRSIGERRRLEGELRNAADRDALVGLFNRRSFRERMEATLGGGDDRSAAALFIDLDDFKSVNDSFGHAAGDQALVEVARRIERALRPNDVAARLGGDEFAALLPACESAEVAQAVADRLLRMFEEPVYAGGREVKLGASIGIALAGDMDDADALMRNADLAMYLAKQRGKGRIEVVESGSPSQVRA